MNKKQWDAFCNYKSEIKKLCSSINKFSEELFLLQKESCKTDTPDYPLENAVVYNTSYDSFTESDEIKLIVIGDNPGKEEQLNKNQKYLVGQSGRIAEGFFRRNPELEIDFRKNVIITNKTPLHTAKTKHLKYLEKNGSKEIREILLSAQIKMAQITGELHKNLVENCEENSFKPQLWMVGYNELKGKGLFVNYRDELKSFYEKNAPQCWDKVFVFQHFSMNRFLIDLKSYRNSNENLSLMQSIENLGHLHRNEIFDKNCI